MKEARCPFCGEKCKPEDKFCVHCGSRLGAPSMGPREPILPQETEEEESHGTLRGILYWLGEYFPGLFRPGVLIGSVVLVVLAIGVGILAVVACLFGVLISGMFIGGFALILYWTALAWLLTGDICMPVDALTDFNGTQWTLFVVMTVLPIGVCLAFLGLRGTK